MSLFSELAKNGQTPLQSLRYGSTYLALPNPDPVLRAIYKRDAYSELLTDGRVVSLIEQRISAVVNKEIAIICDNQKVKEKIERWINSLPYSQIINDAWQGIYYGFMPMELLWNYDKKTDLLLPNAIRRRNLYDFNYNKNNELIYKILGSEINCSQGEWEYKIIAVKRKETYDNPYGEPLASRLFWMVAFKRGGFEFWTQMCEAFANRAMEPPVHGSYAPGATDKDKDAILEALEFLQQSGRAIYPEGAKLNIEDANSSLNGTESNEPLIRICNEEISVAILGHTSASESTAGKLGSEDMGREVRKDIIDGDAEIICGFFQKIIDKICIVNGISDVIEIKLLDKKDTQKETEIQIERDQKLYGTGLRFTKKYYVNKYGYEDDEIEVLEQSPAANFSEKEDSGGVSVDDSESSPVDSSGIIPFFDDTVSVLENIAGDCKDFAEFQEKTLEILGIGDGQLQEFMEQSLVLANLKGRESAK